MRPLTAPVQPSFSHAIGILNLVQCLSRILKGKFIASQVIKIQGRPTPKMCSRYACYLACQKVFCFLLGLISNAFQNKFSLVIEVVSQRRIPFFSVENSYVLPYFTPAEILTHVILRKEVLKIFFGVGFQSITVVGFDYLNLSTSYCQNIFGSCKK